MRVFNLEKNYLESMPVKSVAIVGATGLVGRTMLKVLEERNFPISYLGLYASERSAGTVIQFKNKKYEVQVLEDKVFDGMDIALFSAGGSTSLKYAPIAAAKDCIVIDNSSAWRMDENTPLVVPEVNPEDIRTHKGIIANPNCSTIQLVVALKPIHEKYGLKRVVISTYQSISGAGQKGLDQLKSEIEGNEPANRVSPYPVAYNAVFHSITDPDGFSEEEIKMKKEIRKIMHLPDLKIAVTCVRLPFLCGHGESVNIETEKPIDINELRNVLASSDNVVVIDEPLEQKYPTIKTCENTDPVYVGRIRKDDSVENGAHIWVVADNVRKGAATNAVQIAEYFM
jgi:aspartate-semialdehyde dehydrogenase